MCPAGYSAIEHSSLWQTLIEGVVEERVKASSDIDHWKKKRADEEVAINDAEQIANTTEAELVVRDYRLHYTLQLNLPIRIGRTPPKKWPRRSSKTLDPQQT